MEPVVVTLPAPTTISLPQGTDGSSRGHPKAIKALETQLVTVSHVTVTKPNPAC